MSKFKNWEAMGKRVKVIKPWKSRHGKQDKYINKIGTIVSEDKGYQSPTAYTIVFAGHPLDFETFFQDEIKIYYPESARKYAWCREHLNK